MLAIAAVAYFHVSQVLSSQTQQQLRHQSKLYGLDIYDRLLFLEEKLNILAADFKTTMAADHFEEYFTTVLLINTDTQQVRNIVGAVSDWQTILQLPATTQFIDKPSDSKARLIVADSHSAVAQNRNSRLYLQLALPKQGTEDFNWLLAELNTAYLWDVYTALPYMTHLCVLDATLQPLFCSYPTTTAAFNSFNQDQQPNKKYSFFWQEDGETFLASYWQLFLQGRFNTTPWLIVTYQASTYALSALNLFKQLFPAGVAISVLLVLLLSALQIRRNLVALETLTKGTRAISENQLLRPIDVSSNDEFGDLADSFNKMSKALWEREQKLYQQAHYDGLTNLPNRQLLLDILEREIARSQRDERLTALLFIDLDRFKRINDTLGHAAGDNLLVQAAQRLQSCVRAVDTVARLSGDEFNIVLSDLQKPGHVRPVAEKIIEVLSQPFVLCDQEHFLSASIGIALYPHDGATADELLRNADTAMYRGKQSGRGRYLFFKEQMNADALERSELERELRRALERDQLLLHYQPQLALRSGKITGAEVLLRWQHPSRGFIPPDLFISLAEDTGLIESIGEWVLWQACQQLKHWQTENIPLERIAVNVSTRQFMQANFTNLLADVLQETGILPQSLELEITESLFVDREQQAQQTLQQIKRLGVKLAIDDFGTGYSSLSYLNRFPVDILKIDRTFVEQAPEDQSAAALVTSVIAMAYSLGKEVVVEGVESKQQMDFLEGSGCQLMQGYFVSRPLPAAEFIEFIEQHNRKRPKANDQLLLATKMS